MIQPKITLLTGGTEEAKRAGFNGRNSLFRIKIFTGVPCWVAILGQELYEVHYKQRMVLFIFLAAFALASVIYFAFDSGLYPYLLLLATPFGQKLRKREMELVSHEIESQLAHHMYGRALVDYRREESRRMTGYDHLQGMTPSKIEFEMARRSTTAAKWISKYRPFLTKYLMV